MQTTITFLILLHFLGNSHVRLSGNLIQGHAANNRNGRFQFLYPVYLFCYKNFK